MFSFSAGIGLKICVQSLRKHGKDYAQLILTWRSQIIYTLTLSNLHRYTSLLPCFILTKRYLSKIGHLTLNIMRTNLLIKTTHFKNKAE